MGAKEILEKIAEAQDKIRLLKSEQELAHMHIGKLRKEFAAAIAAGDTSGDSVCDIVTLVHGLNPDLTHRCRELNTQLAGKSGELVMIDFTADVRTRHVFGRGWESEPRRCERIGILNGDHVVVRDGALDFPVVRWTTIVGSSPVTAGLFTPMYGHGGDPPGLVEFIREPVQMNLHIGDEAVKRKLCGYTHDADGKFNKLAEVLGRLVLRP